MKVDILILLTVVGCIITIVNANHYSIKNYHVEFENDVLSAEEEISQAEENTSPKPKNPPPQLFAVLVAGSKGYFNYRHQADLCHAYQILHANGVPDENIVVMMYDDIANSPDNPAPGYIINRPDGLNVYKGVPKDYTGVNVDPKIFVKVLLGDEDGLKGVGSGKVLKSGPNDHVFINFVDHGAPGLVAFPSGELYAKELEATLKKMYETQKYKKLVFYLEACESGSMFENLLPRQWNIFATTAANSTESSYACYWDAEWKAYLGDLYSVMWMENTDQQTDLNAESLQRQFLIVRNETDKSHVMEYGDMRLKNLPVGEFLGTKSQGQPIVYPKVELNPVESGEVPVAVLQRQIKAASSPEEKKRFENKLNRLYKLRKIVSTQMLDIVVSVIAEDSAERSAIFNTRETLTDYECYEKVAKYFSAHCFSIAQNSYVTRKLYILVNMCERGWSADAMIEAMDNTCYHAHLTGIH